MSSEGESHIDEYCLDRKILILCATVHIYIVKMQENSNVKGGQLYMEWKVPMLLAL